tara:strand:- start:84 stop:692 length:609 start_codon:yes stop_codon:yes gene_type:complete
MAVLDLPTFTDSAPTTGPRLTTDPIKLNSSMENNKHALSNALCEDPNWIFFTRKSTEVTAPILTLMAAEECGLTKKINGEEFSPVSVFDILKNVNDTLQSKGKKPITVGSVLSNLHKVVRYLQAAFGICLIINRQNDTGMFVYIRNGIETRETIDKYMKQALRPLIKVAKQLDHAKSLGYEIPSLTGDEHKACQLLASSSSK